VFTACGIMNHVMPAGSLEAEEILSSSASRLPAGNIVGSLYHKL
jgi:hypothetical protein